MHAWDDPRSSGLSVTSVANAAHGRLLYSASRAAPPDDADDDAGDGEGGGGSDGEGGAVSETGSWATAALAMLLAARAEGTDLPGLLAALPEPFRGRLTALSAREPDGGCAVS